VPYPSYPLRSDSGRGLLTDILHCVKSLTHLLKKYGGVAYLII